jgi:3-methyladenine DNA glycosylase Tag
MSLQEFIQILDEIQQQNQKQNQGIVRLRKKVKNFIKQYQELKYLQQKNEYQNQELNSLKQINEQQNQKLHFLKHMKDQQKQEIIFLKQKINDCLRSKTTNFSYIQ